MEIVHETGRNYMVPLLKKLRKALSGCGPVNPFTGMRMLVVGLPNSGKSSLINGLRSATVPVGKNAEKRKAVKVAASGSQPGVTRRIGGPVHLFNHSGPVYLFDTPGVFLPHVSDAETMVKLALCGTVKDSIISRTTLVDYILFRTNLLKPSWYSRFCKPTNDVNEFLNRVATKSGCLLRGGVPDRDGACSRIMSLYNSGEIPGFVADDVHEIQRQQVAARKAEKAANKQAMEAQSNQ